jgi:transposase
VATPLSTLTDAAKGQFATVIKYVAGKLGKSVIFVDPKGTSQHCWNCLNKVPKELSDRWLIVNVGSLWIEMKIQPS